MDLTRLQVETLLNVSATDLDKFIDERNLPCYTLGEEKRFNLLEIESWMLKTKFFETSSPVLPFNFYRALSRGGFCQLDDLEGGSILKLGAYHLSQKLGIDADGLYAILQDRENLASTGMGEGFAIPHPRERIEGINHDVIFVVNLKNPIEFSAIDNQNVHTFFFLMAASDKSHLNLLSKLAHVIANKKASSWIHDQTTHESLLKSVLEWEKTLTNPA
jgi:PTS system nitrogen regulatory IIA component